MTNVKGIILIAFLLAAPIGRALACDNNFDCEIGSKCIKRNFQMTGVCVGGMSPGNENDDRPMKRRDRPYDVGEKYGDTCSNDFECGLGSKCMKSSGSLYGTCM